VFRTLRFGAITLPNVPWPAMVDQWRYLEALGFDHLWTGDHLVNFLRPTEPLFEGWTLLAGLATQTTRARIGLLVSSIAFRNPAFLAKQAITVDHLSNGRLEVGLGAGVAGGLDTSHRMAGLADWPPAERAERFHETVEIVDRLLRDEVTTYHGRHYRIEDAHIFPRPVQQPRPPLVLAAMGPRTIKTAAAYADAWNTYGGYGLSATEALASTRRLLGLLDEACAEFGRDPGAIRRSLLVHRFAGNPFASLDAFREFVGTYREIGIDEFVFYYPPGYAYRPANADQERVFQRAALEAMPALRAETVARGER
jgi:alkanesulfonate monooxygenase SsuD/methylene tetrahydromethanopterin reductase-like flavin-dependent oxidoreductase (luciferase family)